MVLLAALPVAIMGGAWAIYAMKRPDYFRAQISSNGAGRFNFFYAPLETIQLEFTHRFSFYGLYPGRYIVRRIMVLVPLSYLTCLLVGALWSPIRRMPSLKLIAGICAAQWIYQIVLDSLKLHLYLIHLWPFLTILLSAVLYHFWHSQKVARPLLVSFVVAWIMIGLSSSSMLIIRNNFNQTIKPLREALERRTPPDSWIYGPPELGVYIGFGHLIDDLRFGYYTGKVPDYIVMDSRSRQWLDKKITSEPAMVRHVRTLLAQAQVIYTGPEYQMYRVSKVP